MLLYRYKDLGDHQAVELHLSTYRVIRETPCTYLIEPTDRWEQGKWPRRVYKTHPTNPSGKRFAYATTDLAWASWKRRKHHQLWHKENELQRAKRIIEWIEARERGLSPPIPLRRANAPMMRGPGLTLFDNTLEALR